MMRWVHAVARDEPPPALADVRGAFHADELARHARLHSLLETLLFGRNDGPDKDFPQVQDNHLDQVDETQGT